MLIGRFFLMIPVLATRIARRKQPVPPSAGTSRPGASCSSAAAGRRHPRRRLTYFRSLLSADRRTPRRSLPPLDGDQRHGASDGTLWASITAGARKQSMFEPAILRGRSAMPSASSTPPDGAQPVMFVVEGRQRAHDVLFLPRPGVGHAADSTSPGWSRPGCGSRCLRQLRGGRGGGPGKGAGRHAAKTRSETVAHVRAPTARSSRSLVQLSSATSALCGPASSSP